MQFNSLEYALFLALTVLLYYAVARSFPAQKWLVVAASALFYAFWSSSFLLFFIVAMSLNYAFGLWMQATTSHRLKRAILAFAIAANLVNLAVWKYAALAVDSMRFLAERLNWPASALERPTLVLPLAISFYTFHAISYLVDLYRQHPNSKPRGLLEFLFYISMFPHQIAGPILRGHELFPQLEYKRLRFANLEMGLQRILIGLFQKAVIADNLSILADYGYRHPPELSAGETYLLLLAYCFQIFFDFAGYTNMAIGSARLLGYALPENFDNPYISTDIAEFWRRWHMTLSRWIRDYIFIPLGGSRGSSWYTARNLLITMGLAGLWHGASWTFAVWGLYHGVGLVLHRGWSASALRVRLTARLPPLAYKALALVVTFHFVTFGWVLFRSPDFATAGAIFARLAQGFTGVASWHVDEAFVFKTYGFTAMLLYGLVLAIAKLGRVRGAIAQRFELRAMLWGLMLYLTLLLAPISTDPFIYFQF